MGNGLKGETMLSYEKAKKLQDLGFKIPKDKITGSTNGTYEPPESLNDLVPTTDIEELFSMLPDYILAGENICYALSISPSVSSMVSVAYIEPTSRELFMGKEFICDKIVESLGSMLIWLVENKHVSL